MAKDRIIEPKQRCYPAAVREADGAAAKRSLRRHHRQRMIARARRVYALGLNDLEDMEGLEDRAVRNYGHLQCCSCSWWCGNRRKYDGPTIQEKRSWLSTIQELDAPSLSPRLQPPCWLPANSSADRSAAPER
jgi:hypothetical protein